LAAFVAACSTPGAAATPTVAPTPTPIPPTPTTEPTPEPTPAEAPQFTVDDLASYHPDDIVLQYDYEPTFFRPEVFYPFGRVPPFTLYADGTLVYLVEGDTYDQQQVMLVHLTPQDTADLVQQVWDLGYGRLEDHADFCSDAEGEEQVCLADAAYTLLSAAQPGGQVRALRIYANFGGDEAAQEAIVALLNDYTHPSAEVYDPKHAALFIQPMGQVADLELQPWPLDDEVALGFGTLGEGELTALALTGDDLDAVLASLPRNTGDFYFEHAGRVYGAFLAPWLPGLDYTTELQAAFPG
jgi:hypothetical protein